MPAYAAALAGARPRVGPVVAEKRSDTTIYPTGGVMKATLRKHREHLEGRILVPALLWMAGAPFGIVVLLWFFFFRGR
jgi:hypothetical protein